MCSTGVSEPSLSFGELLSLHSLQSIPIDFISNDYIYCVSHDGRYYTISHDYDLVLQDITITFLIITIKFCISGSFPCFVLQFACKIFRRSNCSDILFVRLHHSCLPAVTDSYWTRVFPLPSLSFQQQQNSINLRTANAFPLSPWKQFR
jgi:hypothetical protein